MKKRNYKFPAFGFNFLFTLLLIRTIIKHRENEPIFTSLLIFVIVVLWFGYFFYNTKILKGIGRLLFDLMLLILSILFMVFVFIIIDQIQKIVWVPNDFILYQMNRPYSYFVFLFEIEILLFVFTIANLKGWFLKFTDFSSKILKYSKQYKKAVLAVNLLILYLIITSITVVEQNQITQYSWYNLVGKTYQYTDIVEVNTGFTKPKSNYSNRGGDFYYTVKFKDQTSITFKDVTANSSKFDVTFNEYVALDKIIMKGNVKKVGSSLNAKYANLDSKYIEILLGVISNKNNE